MEPDDPFGWLLEECRMLPSEEADLRNCSYLGAPVSVVSVVTTMPSPPPVSSEEEDVFQTTAESMSTTASSSDNRMVGESVDPVASVRDAEEIRVSKRLKSSDSESSSGASESSLEKSLEAVETKRGSVTEPDMGKGKL